MIAQWSQPRCRRRRAVGRAARRLGHPARDPGRRARAAVGLRSGRVRGGRQRGPVETASSAVEREVLPPGGSVLDVGSGGGRGSLVAGAPGRPHQGGRREPGDARPSSSGQPSDRGIAVVTHQGRWPDIADSVPPADLVVCHHVVYNVPDIVPFLVALTDHARLAVVRRAHLGPSDDRCGATPGATSGVSNARPVPPPTTSSPSSGSSAGRRRRGDASGRRTTSPSSTPSARRAVHPPAAVPAGRAHGRGGRLPP